jgi:glutamine amidotransferase
MKVAVLDYGVGNLFKVAHAFETLGAKVDIISDPSDINEYSHVVLPGVGNFGSGVKAFNDSNLREGVDQYVKSGKPLLGICLGMQMLFNTSEESTEEKGLGYIAGKCIRFSPETSKFPTSAGLDYILRKKGMDGIRLFAEI